MIKMRDLLESTLNVDFLGNNINWTKRGSVDILELEPLSKIFGFAYEDHLPTIADNLLINLTYNTNPSLNKSNGKFDYDYLKDTIEITKMPITKLIATQKIVYRDAIESNISNSSFPMVVCSYKGKNYIVDGYHRFVRNILKGKSNFPCYILDLNK